MTEAVRPLCAGGVPISQRGGCVVVHRRAGRRLQVEGCGVLPRRLGNCSLRLEQCRQKRMPHNTHSLAQCQPQRNSLVREATQQSPQRTRRECIPSSSRPALPVSCGGVGACRQGHTSAAPVALAKSQAEGRSIPPHRHPSSHPAGDSIALLHCVTRSRDIHAHPSSTSTPIPHPARHESKCWQTRSAGEPVGHGTPAPDAHVDPSNARAGPSSSRTSPTTSAPKTSSTSLASSARYGMRHQALSSPHNHTNSQHSQIRQGIAATTKGTAFVVYEDVTDAKSACDKLNGFNFQQRYLVVLYHQPGKGANKGGASGGASTELAERQENLERVKKEHGIE